MTTSITQQPTAKYSGGVTAINNTFSVAPTAGNLIVFSVWVSNNATITADDGSLVEIATGYETFRRCSVFAKIAGALEPVTYSFTISTSSDTVIYATEYEETEAWDTVTAGTNTIDFDSTGSNFEITSTPISTDAGSLLLATGYSADTGDGNQEINTGFSNFIQPLATGNARRSAQADKASAGGSQTAQFSLVDSGTDTRLAIALVEFKVVPGGDTVTPGASNYTFGDTITYTTTLTGLTSATLTDTNANVFTLTSVTDTSADIPAISPGLDACLTGAVTLTVSDGVDIATAALALDPLAGHISTTLVSLAGTPSWVADFNTAAEIGDQGQKDEVRLTLNDDGSYVTTGTTSFSDVVWVTSKTGGEITQVTLNFSPAGGSSNYGLTFRNLTARGL